MYAFMEKDLLYHRHSLCRISMDPGKPFRGRSKSQEVTTHSVLNLKIFPGYRNDRMGLGTFKCYCTNRRGVNQIWQKLKLHGISGILRKWTPG